MNYRITGHGCYAEVQPHLPFCSSNFSVIVFLAVCIILNAFCIHVHILSLSLLDFSVLVFLTVYKIFMRVHTSLVLFQFSVIVVFVTLEFLVRAFLCTLSLLCALFELVCLVLAVLYTQDDRWKGMFFLEFS